MARHKDKNWDLSGEEVGPLAKDQILIALLMDLRDELKLIRASLNIMKDRDNEVKRYMRRIDARLASVHPLPRGKKYDV